MTFYHTLLEQYAIMESLESTIKSNPHIPESIIRGYHSNALPDNNKNDRLLNHVLKMHTTGAITLDTAHQLKPHLTALSNTNQLHQLKQLNTLEDHINATKDIMDKSVTKKERTDVNTPTVFENDHIIVKQHLTHESAIKGARLHPENPVFKKTNEHGKAQWCLSLGGEDGEDHFKYYTENGKHPMYTIFNKKTKRSTAFVANPNTVDSALLSHRLVNENEIDPDEVLEIRDEKDKLLPIPVLFHRNPGIEHSVVGKFVKEHFPQSLTHHIETHHIEIESKEDVDKALDNPDPLIRKWAIKSPYATAEHITKALNDPTALVRAQAIQHENVNEGHITQALNDFGPNETYNGKLKNYSTYVRSLAAAHKLATEKHLTKALKDPNVWVRRAAMQHNNIDAGHVTLALNDESQEIRNLAIGHKLASLEQVKKVLNHPDPEVRYTAYFNPNITEPQITDGLNDTDPTVREFAVRHANANEDHITTASDDVNKDVRRWAYSHKNANATHLLKALDDTNDYTRDDALHHKNTNVDHITKALDDPSSVIRSIAISHRLANEGHFIKALNDPSEEIRNMAKAKLDLMSQ